MNNKVLITGASGFLGQSLKRYFENHNFKVITLGRNQSCELVNDLSTTVPKLPYVDMVVHAAGKAHLVPKNKYEENEFFKVNFQGTVNLCKGLENTDNLPNEFIFISTVAVYGIDYGELIDESHPLNGFSPYAKSKIDAELFLINWARENQVVLTILRLPLIVGPNPPGNLGAMIKGIKSGKYASIGKANAKKSMIWVEDIPKFIFEIKELGGIYNLTDGYHPTFGELELHISQKFNKSKPISIPLNLAKSVAWLGDLIGGNFPINSCKLRKITSTLTFNSDKAMNVSNWKPSRVLEKL